jgi:tRNA A37 threonylcarbamoyladenosine dehydratase
MGKSQYDVIASVCSLCIGLGFGIALGAALSGWHKKSAPLPVTPMNAPEQPPAAGAPAAEAQREILEEQLSRNAAFFGASGQAAIGGSFVCVVGVGGVGSHAAHMLARSGVGRLRLIDFDMVTLSSLNRHATAVRADVGTPKVVALARAIARITPACRVEAVQALMCSERAEALLEGSPSFVLDCIDDRDTKVALLMFCKARGLRVVSSMGAGGKSDPTRLRFCDLALLPGGAMDPLGTAIKAALRKAGMIQAQFREGSGGGGGGGGGGGAAAAIPPPTLSGITCLFSAEEPRAALLPLPTASECAAASAASAAVVSPQPEALAAGERLVNPSEIGALDNFRVRIMPVLGTMPALFGQALAAYVVCALAGGGHALSVPLESPGHTAGSAKALAVGFKAWEEERYPRSAGWGCTCGVSLEEVDFLVGEAWHARSPVSHLRLGVRGVRLQLCRWRPWGPSTPGNLVLLTDDEAAALAETTQAPAVWGLAREALQLGVDFNAPCASGERGGAGRALETLEGAWRAAAAQALGGQGVVGAIEGRLAWVREKWGC